jgi:hypothetical protein
LSVAVSVHLFKCNQLLEKLAALVPLPRMHLVRYGGCLAPHSSLRGAIIPTPRQQGVDEEQTETTSPRWSWARLLKRVFALDMVRCPFGRNRTVVKTGITPQRTLSDGFREAKTEPLPPAGRLHMRR